MSNADSLEQIIAPPSYPDWEDDRRQSAALQRLHPTPVSNPIALEVLSQWEQRYLSAGAFSRVCVLDNDRVLKFCRDLTSLQIMARLGARSRFFPRVDLVLADQAVSLDEVTGREQIYHVAVVERLQEGYPRWACSLVDGYRRPFRADSPIFASTRLYGLSERILSGDLKVPASDVVELAEAMRLLAQECENEGCLADLRTELNVMLRHGRMAVIADPTHPIESHN